MRAALDRAALPTAPRAARGPDIDTTKIPDGPPFTAFLGNLSYDVDKDDILEFFGSNKVFQILSFYEAKLNVTFMNFDENKMFFNHCQILQNNV